MGEGGLAGGLGPARVGQPKEEAGQVRRPGGRPAEGADGPGPPEGRTRPKERLGLIRELAREPGLQPKDTWLGRAECSFGP